MKKIAPFAGVALCLAAPIGLAQDATQETKVENEKPRVLGTVNITGKASGKPAPTTGRLIMAVDVIAQNRRIRSSGGIQARRESRAAQTVESYRLSMRAVDFPADGSPPTLRPREAGPRNFDYNGGNDEEQFVAFDLAPGYYILSNINFNVTQLDRSDIDPFTGDFTDGASSPSLSASFRSSRSSVDYCINEKTIVFEVVEGQTSYLGYLQLSEPPRNRSRQGAHVPIVGFDQNIEIFKARSNWDDRTESEIYITPVKTLPFDTSGSTCQVAGAHRVKGWESSEEG